MSFNNRGAWAVIAAGALVASVGFASPAYAAPNNNSVKKLTKAVTVDGVSATSRRSSDRRRQRRKPGGRAARVQGVGRLRRRAARGRRLRPDGAGVRVRLLRRELRADPRTPQPDDVRERDRLPAQHVRPGPPRAPRPGRSFRSGWSSRPGRPANSNTSGCEAPTSLGIPAGGIALVQRGTCGFAIKALNAQAAGAAGVVIMNEGQPGRDRPRRHDRRRHRPDHPRRVRHVRRRVRTWLYARGARSASRSSSPPTSAPRAT